jgi:Tol biopolymer transport system component
LPSVLGARWVRFALVAAGLVLLVVLVYALPRRGGEPAQTRPEKLPGLILFWHDTPWPSLWSVRPDGTGLRRIYHTRQNAKRPRLSPDRKWIAFDGAAPGKRPLTDFDVQTVRTDGTHRRTLAGTPEYELDAQWSPDGTRLSYSSYRHTGEADEWLGSRI